MLPISDASLLKLLFLPFRPIKVTEEIGPRPVGDEERVANAAVSPDRLFLKSSEAVVRRRLVFVASLSEHSSA